jgi:hypothetical protein
VIAVSGKCAARVVADRIVCRARGMEEMMESCQFFKAQGTTCRHRSTGSYRACRNPLVSEWLRENE